MAARLICVRRDKGNGVLTPCLPHDVGSRAQVGGLERCPDCMRPLHRLPFEQRFWSVVDELVGPAHESEQGSPRVFSTAAVDWYFGVHPNWGKALSWSWLHVLVDEQCHPESFGWRVRVHDDNVYFTPKR